MMAAPADHVLPVSTPAMRRDRRVRSSNGHANWWANHFQTTEVTIRRLRRPATRGMESLIVEPSLCAVAGPGAFQYLWRIQRIRWALIRCRTMP